MKINLEKNTVDRLAKLGNASQNYSDVIEKLVSHAEICDRFWSEKE